MAAIEGATRAPDYLQSPRSSWTGGHFIDPNEQNTQQSPGLGRIRALQFVHS